MKAIATAADPSTWTDAHLHAWDASVLRAPWFAQAPQFAGKFDLARYGGEGGVRGGLVFVEADVAPADRAREACATLALRERGIKDHTARRAADAWLRAAVAEDEPIAPPSELLALAARMPAIAEASLPVIGQLTFSLEEALLRGDLSAARKSAEDRLAPLLRIADASPAAATAVVARASALAELAAGRADEAFARADRAVKRWPSDRALLWLRAESARRQGAGDEAVRARAFALFRELSPLAAKSRDEFWWRAQLAQLEMLSDDPAQREQVLARINRLSALDASMGSPLLSRRFEELRRRCMRSPDGAPR